MRAGERFRTANESAIDALLAGESSGFDPRSSFYPQTLLKAEDLRVSLPRPPKPRTLRYAKPLAALVLAIGAGLAYVFFLAPPAPENATREPSAKGSTSQAGAVGTITTPAAPIAPPVAVEPARPVTPPDPTATPSPRAPSPRTAAPARAASAVSSAQSAAGPRSTVTHTKAAIEAADAPKNAAPVPTAAAVVAPAIPASSPGAACTEALAALGLCTPAKGN